jgi:hypothetical protein
MSPAEAAIKPLQTKTIRSQPIFAESGPRGPGSATIDHHVLPSLPNGRP